MTVSPLKTLTSARGDRWIWSGVRRPPVHSGFLDNLWNIRRVPAIGVGQTPHGGKRWKSLLNSVLKVRSDTVSMDTSTGSVVSLDRGFSLRTNFSVDASLMLQISNVSNLLRYSIFRARDEKTTRFTSVEVMRHHNVTAYVVRRKA